MQCCVTSPKLQKDPSSPDYLHYPLYNLPLSPVLPSLEHVSLPRLAALFCSPWTLSCRGFARADRYPPAPSADADACALQVDGLCAVAHMRAHGAQGLRTLACENVSNSTVNGTCGLFLGASGLVFGVAFPQGTRKCSGASTCRSQPDRKAEKVVLLSQELCPPDP